MPIDNSVHGHFEEYNFRVRQPGRTVLGTISLINSTEIHAYVTHAVFSCSRHCQHAFDLRISSCGIFIFFLQQKVSSTFAYVYILCAYIYTNLRRTCTPTGAIPVRFFFNLVAFTLFFSSFGIHQNWMLLKLRKMGRGRGSGIKETDQLVACPWFTTINSFFLPLNRSKRNW